MEDGREAEERSEGGGGGGGEGERRLGWSQVFELFYNVHFVQQKIFWGKKMSIEWLNDKFDQKKKMSSFI